MRKFIICLLMIATSAISQKKIATDSLWVKEKFIYGTAGNGLTYGSWGNGLAWQMHMDTSGVLSMARIYGGSSARIGGMFFDDLSNRFQLLSINSGTVPGGGPYPWTVGYSGFGLHTTFDTTGGMIVGGINNGVIAGDWPGPAIQVHGDTTIGVSAYRIYPGPAARHITVQVDDINDVMRLISGETGTPPGGGLAFPLEIGSGSNYRAIRVYEDSTVIGSETLKVTAGLNVSAGSAIVGNANSGAIAGSWPADVIQVQGDTTIGVSAYRIYPGPAARHITMQVDDINDYVSLISGETGTPPGGGGAAFPLTLGSGSNFWGIIIYEDSTVVRSQPLKVTAGLRIPGSNIGDFWRGADNLGNGEWVKPEPKFTDAIAAFPTPTNGAVLDTVGGIEEVYNFDVGDTVTIKWLVPVGGDLDSLVINLSTPDAAGDSCKFGFMYRVRSNGDNVTGAFVFDSYTQTIDMPDGGDKIVRMKIELNDGVVAGSVLLGKVFRMAAAANEVQDVMRLHEKLAYFK